MRFSITPSVRGGVSLLTVFAVLACQSESISAPMGPPSVPAVGTLTTNAFTSRGDPGSGIRWRWTGATVVSDSASPDGPMALQFTYAAGRTGGTAPGNVYLDEAALRSRNLPSATIRGWLYVSPNWYGHPSLVNKTLFVGMGLNGNQVYVSLKGSGNGTLQPRLAFQGMAAKPTPNGTCGNGGCAGDVGGGSFSRGAWHSIAVNVGPTSASLAVDGLTVGVASGLVWRTTGAPYLAKVALNPTWGGIGSTVPATQFLRWDGVTVSTP
ncbi:MAG: hypothetical protein IPI92_19370 [Gemmatimonadetes bacterium]|jgi:hypothetical protein|nr:hypothetical protein [Gemmatimonadota bacterium]MBK7352017.1 hypothetical protein [Gemmatimonadota bacterium]MBK7784946.1 hypothetical protein [Gemmatimonadota bacterium]MBK9066618.1 hypothetical protein [Gemmatimonadota bacterium]MBP9200550.1 hypothetical protein [Gemmatimonadales bacterium]